MKKTKPKKRQRKADWLRHPGIDAATLRYARWRRKTPNSNKPENN